MRTRTRGIQLAVDGGRSVDKVYRGVRIYERLGKVSQDEAEAWVRARQAEIDAQRENDLRAGDQQLFAAAAAKYLIECQRKGLRTLDTISYHVTILLPYIGKLPLLEVCNDALEGFKDDRAEDGVKNATINRSLEVVRTVMNRAARVWRSNGRPWLASSPLIEMLDETQQRRPPYPITWQQQASLMLVLPAHLRDMLLFAVNTGARDDNICRLQWAWERPVPELKRSVFVIPASEFKGKRDHVLILNDVAWKVVEARRGRHEQYVFAYRRERVKHHDREPAMKFRPLGTMNNTAWQAARKLVGLEHVRVHDLRHTYGQRLRAAGVSEEDRALLLGHAIEDMPQHYATATIERLVKMANRANTARDRTTVLRVVNG